MSRLAPKIWIFTPAGNLLVPDFFEPYFPPEEESLRAAHHYLFRAGVPVAKWKEWACVMDVAKVSEIKSLYNLFTLWLFIMRWQYENGVEPSPVDEIGTMVKPYARDYLLHIGLTPKEPNVVSVSHP